MKYITLFVAVLFSVAMSFANAEESKERAQSVINHLDSEMLSSVKQTHVEMLINVYAMDLEYKLLIEEKLKTDPKNKELRAEYEKSLTMEKLGFKGIKEYLLSGIDPNNKQAREKFKKSFTPEYLKKVSQG